MNHQFKKFLNVSRFGEIILMTGFSLIGLLFVPIKEWHAEKVFLLLLQSISFVTTVYFLNSFADYETDQKTHRLKEVSTISASSYFYMMVVGIILFTLFGFLLHIRVAIIGLLAFCFWCLYYIPPLRLKASFLLGTVIHFVCGILHFHIGFGWYDLNLHSLANASYIALLLSMGHFNHELLDYEDDLKTNTRTTAVRIGQQKVIWLRRALLIISILYLQLLTQLGIMSWSFASVFLLASVLTLTLDFSQNPSPSKYQKIIRALFLTAGLIYLIRIAL